MSKSDSIVCLLMLLLMVGQSGCDESGDVSTKANPAATDSNTNNHVLMDQINQPANTKNTPDANAEASVSLEIVSLQRLQQIISQPRPNLLVCDFWSTSCQPCMDEFPHLVELDRHHGSKIDCLSVSLDFESLPKYPIEKCQAEALEFLKQQQATFSNLIVNQDSLDVLDEMGVGSIPFVDVYQNGKLLRRFVTADNRPFTYEKDVIPYVEELLAREDK